MFGETPMNKMLRKMSLHSYLHKSYSKDKSCKIGDPRSEKLSILSEIKKSIP